MGQYILALDQGTTSSRAIVFNKSGKVVSLAQKEYEQYYPKQGWVEHDPNEIWYSQASVAVEALSRANISGFGTGNHKPARNYNYLGQRNRRTGLQCHRLARPPRFRLL